MAKPALLCGFCQRSDETPTTGPLFKKNNVIAHENCLLYSSGIFSKNTPDFDDLCGFAEEDVIKEMRRGRRLKCYKCNKIGATVGCEVRACKKSYHYPCAMEDDAENHEDIPKGIFKLYCKLHRKPSGGDSNKKSFNKETRLKLSTPNGKAIESEEDCVPGPSKRRKLGTPLSDTKNQSRRFLDSSDSSGSDVCEKETLEFEQAPIETDLDDSGENEAAGLNDKRNFSHEPQPSTSGDQLPSDKATLDEDETDSDQYSESLLVPMKVAQLDSLAKAAPEPSSPPLPPPADVTPVSSSSASDFWTTCRDAGCVESIFSTFISSVISLSERMMSSQASKEDCVLSFNLLKASGLLQDIFAQKDQELCDKQKSLQEEMERVQKARDAMMKASTVGAIFPKHNMV